MFRYPIVLVCAVLVLSNVTFIQAEEDGDGGDSEHSKANPSPGGFSDEESGHSGYPADGENVTYSNSEGSSGLSGRSYLRKKGKPGGHLYPKSDGKSGNNHGPPGGGKPGGHHVYPISDGKSGNNHGPPGGGKPGAHHVYPISDGKSGNNHGPHGSTKNNNHYYNHYQYNPPQQIHYPSPHGGPAINYPVYHGTPPIYVYQYKNSGSKYDTLLTGLALYNLGVLSGRHRHHDHHYKPEAGEVCIFGIKKDNGDFEETKIECHLISSFIYAEQAKQQNSTKTTVVTTVTNTTTINTTNAQDRPVYMLAPNGTLISSALGPDAGNSTNATSATGGSVTSQVMSVTVTNTTVNALNAVDVKGPSIKVTQGMQCYVIRKTPRSRMRREVPCGLLQTYATKSLKPSSAARNVPAFTILTVMFVVFINNF